MLKPLLCFSVFVLVCALRENYMTRTAVIRTSGTSRICVNDEIGLDSFCDYTLNQHLEDLASDGIRLLSKCGDVHLFSDLSTQSLHQERVTIDMGSIDEETLSMMLSAVALPALGHFDGGRAFLPA